MSDTVIDVHAHLLPDVDAVRHEPGVELGDDGRLVVDGHRLGLLGLYEPETLVAGLVRHGLDAAWVSAPPPTYRQGMTDDETGNWVRALHSGLRSRVADHPTLSLLAYLPLDRPAVAVSFAHAVLDDPTDLATVGWTASAGGGSLPLDDVRLAALWSLLEQSGRPLLLHPGESPDSRLDRHYLANLLGNPVETGVAVGQLLLGGVLERHPGLRIVLVHCAGVVPTLVGRWARGVETERPGITAGTTDPRVAVRALYTDTLAHSPAVVDLALAVLGRDRLLLGSDYPFPMGVADPFSCIDHLPAEVRHSIARNAAALIRRHR